MYSNGSNSETIRDNTGAIIPRTAVLDALKADSEYMVTLLVLAQKTQAHISRSSATLSDLSMRMHASDAGKKYPVIPGCVLRELFLDLKGVVKLMRFNDRPGEAYNPEIRVMWDLLQHENSAGEGSKWLGMPPLPQPLPMPMPAPAPVRVPSLAHLEPVPSLPVQQEPQQPQPLPRQPLPQSPPQSQDEAMAQWRALKPQQTPFGQIVIPSVAMLEMAARHHIHTAPSMEAWQAVQADLLASSTSDRFGQCSAVLLRIVYNAYKKFVEQKFLLAKHKPASDVEKLMISMLKNLYVVPAVPAPQPTPVPALLSDDVIDLTASDDDDGLTSTLSTGSSPAGLRAMPAPGPSPQLAQQSPRQQQAHSPAGQQSAQSSSSQSTRSRRTLSPAEEEALQEAMTQWRALRPRTTTFGQFVTPSANMVELWSVHRISTSGSGRWNALKADLLALGDKFGNHTILVLRMVYRKFRDYIEKKCIQGKHKAVGEAEKIMLAILLTSRGLVGTPMAPLERPPVAAQQQSPPPPVVPSSSSADSSASRFQVPSIAFLEAVKRHNAHRVASLAVWRAIAADLLAINVLGTSSVMDLRDMFCNYRTYVSDKFIGTYEVLTTDEEKLMYSMLVDYTSPMASSPPARQNYTRTITLDWSDSSDDEQEGGDSSNTPNGESCGDGESAHKKPKLVP